jgi:hypothetical protein
MVFSKIIFFTIPIFCTWNEAFEGAYLYREREIRGAAKRAAKSSGQ